MSFFPAAQRVNAADTDSIGGNNRTACRRIACRTCDVDGNVCNAHSAATAPGFDMHSVGSNGRADLLIEGSIVNHRRIAIVDGIAHRTHRLRGTTGGCGGECKWRSDVLTAGGAADTDTCECG